MNGVIHDTLIGCASGAVFGVALLWLGCYALPVMVSDATDALVRFHHARIIKVREGTQL